VESALNTFLHYKVILVIQILQLTSEVIVNNIININRKMDGYIRNSTIKKTKKQWLYHSIQIHQTPAYTTLHEHALLQTLPKPKKYGII